MRTIQLRCRDNSGRGAKVREQRLFLFRTAAEIHKDSADKLRYVNLTAARTAVPGMIGRGQKSNRIAHFALDFLRKESVCVRS